MTETRADQPDRHLAGATAGGRNAIRSIRVDKHHAAGIDHIVRGAQGRARCVVGDGMLVERACGEGIAGPLAFARGRFAIDDRRKYPGDCTTKDADTGLIEFFYIISEQKREFVVALPVRRLCAERYSERSIGT